MLYVFGVVDKIPNTDKIFGYGEGIEKREEFKEENKQNNMILTKEQIYQITHTYARPKGKCICCDNNKIHSSGLCRKCYKYLIDNKLMPKKHRKTKDVANETEFRKMRLKVLERDNHKCVQCGSTFKINVHHKKHRGKGGDNSLKNLETLCYYCHMDKHKDENVINIMAQRL